MNLSIKVFNLYNDLIEVVEAINTVNEFKENLGYVPSRLFYKEVDLESPGIYSSSSDGLMDSVSSVEALCEGVIEMENLIKKNLKLS